MDNSFFGRPWEAEENQLEKFDFYDTQTQQPFINPDGPDDLMHALRWDTGSQRHRLLNSFLSHPESEMTNQNFTNMFGTSYVGLLPEAMRQVGPSCFLYAACLCIYLSPLQRSVGEIFMLDRFNKPKRQRTRRIYVPLPNNERLFEADVVETWEFVTESLQKRFVNVRNLPQKCLRLLTYYHHMSREDTGVGYILHDSWNTPLEDGAYVHLTFLTLIKMLGIYISDHIKGAVLKLDKPIFSDEFFAEDMLDEPWLRDLFIEQALEYVETFVGRGMPQTERKYESVTPLIYTIPFKMNDHFRKVAEDIVLSMVRMTITFYDIFRSTHAEMDARLSHMILCYEENGKRPHGVLLFIDKLFSDPNAIPLVLDGNRGILEEFDTYLLTRSFPMKLYSLDFFLTFSEDTFLFSHNLLSSRAMQETDPLVFLKRVGTDSDDSDDDSVHKKRPRLNTLQNFADTLPPFFTGRSGATLPARLPAPAREPLY